MTAPRILNLVLIYGDIPFNGQTHRDRQTDTATTVTLAAHARRGLMTTCISLSVTQSAFASTSDRPLCFPRACVGLIGPRPSDYPHALSACYYFLPAVFLLALGLWSSLPARQLSLDTPYSFLTFSVFFCFLFFF